jgi:hypothetical protein
MAKKVVILGGGESGTGAAILAKKQGLDVFLSDAYSIKPEYETILKEFNIPYEIRLKKYDLIDPKKQLYNISYNGGYLYNEFELDELVKFDKILLSPGPGIPDEAGLLKAVISKYAESKSILGVCLGQQAIAEVFGGTLINLDKVFHGVATKVTKSVTDELCPPQCCKCLLFSLRSKQTRAFGSGCSCRWF